MAMLSEVDRKSVQDLLASMTSPVRVLFFTQSLGCETCAPTRQILDEVVPLNPLLSLEEYNFILDADKAAEYKIDKVPAIALVNERDTGIRFYGAPAGYEFMSLLEAILLASGGQSGLSEESRTLVAAVDQPMNIQVFVTPT